MTWAGVATANVPLHAFPRAVGLLMVANWTAVLAGVALALVGLWRSARAGAPRPVPRPVAWVVRLALVGGWLLWIAVGAVIALRDAREYAPLAFGAAERDGFSFRILREGRELEVRGTLGFGITDDLRAELDRHPQVRIVHLHSTGGRLLEGLRLAPLLRSRGLATYVSERCESACALAYAGGEPRLLAQGARIGLHAPSRASVGAVADRRSVRSTRRSSPCRRRARRRCSARSRRSRRTERYGGSPPAAPSLARWRRGVAAGSPRAE